METQAFVVQHVHYSETNTDTDVVAVEEPLELILEYWLDGQLRRKQLAITMRTPGDDAALAAGFLWAEGIINTPNAIAAITISTVAHENRLTISLQRTVEPNLAHLERNFYLGASCGVCGKTSIEALYNQQCAVLPENTITVAPAVLQGLPEALRAAQATFAQTGGVHAAGLFTSDGTLVDLAEDIGRHNALDKLLGRQVLANALPLNAQIVLLSGRISFELVQKAVRAGVCVLAAVGAPSSLAIELAQRFNLTLVGFVRGQRFNIYAGSQRISEPSVADTGEFL